MKTTTSVALLSLIAGIAAHPSANRLYVRDCKPGFLVCQGNDQFGLCNIDSTAIFMKVAEGTKCICSGSDCTIAAIDGDAPAPEQPSQEAPAPAPAPTPTSQASPPPSTDSKPEPAPETAQPAPQTPQESAPQSPPAPASTTEAAAPAATSAGGIFKEAPTDSGAKAVAPKPSTAEPSTSEPAASETSAPESSSGPSPSSGSGGINIGSGKSYIKTFLGNGDTSSGWPAEDQWASFDTMWEANLENIISKSCTGFGQANNSPSESADLKSAIENVAQSSGVDARFILAIAMQESNGCVRAPTTNYGVTNPGVMQSHNGDHSCYDVNPCPKDTIQGMIEDGTMGTASGDGLKQLLAQVGGSGVSQFYKAARMYNSGSIAASGLLQDGIATHCYASDIANRLVGWSEGVGGCKMS